MNNELFAELIGDSSYRNSKNSNDAESSIMESDIDKAFIIIAALKESCTPEEYSEIMESINSLELYDVIPNGTSAMEATEKRIIKYTFTSKLSQATKAACLRIAKTVRDPLYAKYRKARSEMFKNREKLYKKYESKGSRLAKDILRNAKNASSSMKNKIGTGISDKLDKTIKRIENTNTKK